MSYVLPQVQVFQEFRQLPNAVTANLNAFVFGPHYKLFRYAVADEKSLIGLGAYDPANAADFAYPFQPAGSTVDLTYVKLYMENVWAQYAALPATGATPLVCMSPIERNKLRAAPRVYCQANYKGRNTGGVTFEDNVAGGFYTGGIALPENYYFFPQSTGALDVDDVTLAYATTEGYSGSTLIEATNNPLVSGVYTPLADGIVAKLSDATRAIVKLQYTASTEIGALDAIVIDGTTLTEGTELTAGTGVAAMKALKAAYEAKVAATGEAKAVIEVHETNATTGALWVIKNAASIVVDVTGWTTGTPPTVVASAAWAGLLRVQSISFIGNGGTELAISLKPAAVAALGDDDIDSNLQFNVSVTDSAGGGHSVTYTAGTKTLAIEWDSTAVTTLAQIRAEIVGDSDVGDMFDATVLDADQGAEEIASVEDATGPLGDGYNVFMVRDIFRVSVDANAYVFAAGNGSEPSSHFKTRGVKVGDRVRYSVLGTDAITHTGTTYVTAIEADVTNAVLNPPEVSDDNKAGQAGSALEANQVASDNDIVEAGAENRRDFDGVLTAVYALSTYDKYPGEYSKGLLSDTYSVEITTAGVAGVARATVTSTGGYYREDAKIEVDPVADGALFLGNNLWIRFDKGSGDADAEFQLGDTYSFSVPVEAPYNAVPAQDLTVTGKYRGPRDTTYVVEVVRGGVFDRVANVADGLQTANKYTLTVTAGSPAGKTLTIGGVALTAAGANAGAILVDMAAKINAANVRAFATTTAISGDTSGTLVVQAPSATIAGIVLAADAGWSGATVRATLTVDLDWNAGDVDDEYMLQCTQAGTLATAVFSLRSVNGDIESGIQFTDGVAKTIGAQGIDATITLSGAPQFAIGDYYIIKVYGARPQVRITDTAGVDQASYTVVTPADPIALGSYGGYVAFATNRNLHGGLATGSNGGLVKGDVFHITALASANGALKTLVLADDLPAEVITGREVGDVSDTSLDNDWTPNFNPTEFAVWLYLVQESTEIASKKVQSPPDRNWEATDALVTVNEAIAVQDASWVNGDGSQDYLPVYKADMYLQYRALLSDYAGSIYSISDIGDVVDTLGVVHPDNPLAQGVFNALTNSGDQAVYFMGVPSNDLDGYSEVLDRAGLVDTVYGLVPLSRDEQIKNAVAAHVNDLSGAENKRWRIAFVASDIPTVAAVYTAANSADGATDWLATVVDNPGVAGTQYTLVTLTNGSPTLLNDVEAGDLVRIRFSADAWGDASYEEYPVDRVLTNNTLLIVGGPAVAVNVPSKIEIWHENTSAEIAASVKAQSENYGDRRVYHVFPNAFFTDGVLQTGEFAAAAVAGLVSSVPPQQPMTSIEITGFTDVPSVYRTFNRTQLNTIAEGGTMILMQDQAGGRIYIRHQLSTARKDGNLLTTELSITKNLDAISYYMAAVLEPFYGRYNITPELLTVIQTQIQNGLNYLGSDKVAVGLLGPMIILENDYTRIRSLEQHPTLRDHIVAIVDLELPLPANVIQLRLVVGDNTTGAVVAG